MTRIKIAQCLESLFAAIERWAGAMRERVALCPNCGRNRYTGERCNAKS